MGKASVSDSNTDVCDCLLFFVYLGILVGLFQRLVFLARAFGVLSALCTLVETHWNLQAQEGMYRGDTERQGSWEEKSWSDPWQCLNMSPEEMPESCPLYGLGL